MSLFTYRLTQIVSILFLCLNIANVVVTLMLVDEIKSSKDDGRGTLGYDSVKLNFVQVCNILNAALLGLSFVFALVGTPLIIRYQRRTQSLLDAGLRPAGIAAV